MGNKQEISVANSSLTLLKQGKNIISSAYGASITIAEAQNTDQLGTLSVTEGEEITQALIAILINELIMFVPHELTPEHIILFSKRIQKEYWYLKIGDLIIAFRDGSNGRYGKGYHKLNYQLLNEWIMAYEKSKQEHLKSAETTKRDSVAKGQNNIINNLESNKPKKQ